MWADGLVVIHPTAGWDRRAVAGVISHVDTEDRTKLRSRLRGFFDLVDVRFPAAYSGLKSDIAPCPKSAMGLNRSRSRTAGAGDTAKTIAQQRALS